MTFTHILVGIILFVLMATLMKITKKDKEGVENMDYNGDVFANKEARVSVAKAKEIIAADKDLLIIDTRSKGEYNAKHIEGAIAIPYNTLERDLDKLDGYEDKPILVYCATGSRSAVAVDILIENGFNKIYHMYSGFSRWR